MLADPDRFRGVLGSFAAQLTVADGYQKAVAAALGAAAEALTVNGLDAAVEVLDRHPHRQRRHRRPRHRRLAPGDRNPVAPGPGNAGTALVTLATRSSPRHPSTATRARPFPAARGGRSTW